jgi:hypothetical protein
LAAGRNDGRVAVDEKYEVEGQHTWLEFRFELPQGRHTLKAVSTAGDAERAWSFSALLVRHLERAHRFRVARTG